MPTMLTECLGNLGKVERILWDRIDHKSMVDRKNLLFHAQNRYHQVSCAILGMSDRWTMAERTHSQRHILQLLGMVKDCMGTL